MFLSAVLTITSLYGAPARERILAVGGEVKAPVKIKNCEPQFPARLNKRRITQPFFIYEVVISDKGEVISVRQAKDRHLGEPYATMDHAFRKAILCWRFRPATLHGQPVACRYTISATAEVR